MTTTNRTNNNTDWAEKIGKPAMASIREMVAALECDYDRLEELREAYADLEAEDAEALEELRREWTEDNGEEFKELQDAAGECEDREDAERRIHKDAPSVAVRSDWCNVGEEDMTPAEFQILLCTGGPAVRIMGELDGHGEPRRAWLEVQDWGKPWTEYYEPDAADVLLAYARCFVFSC